MRSVSFDLQVPQEGANLVVVNMFDVEHVKRSKNVRGLKGRNSQLGASQGRKGTRKRDFPDIFPRLELYIPSRAAKATSRVGVAHDVRFPDPIPVRRPEAPTEGRSGAKEGRKLRSRQNGRKAESEL